MGQRNERENHYPLALNITYIKMSNIKDHPQYWDLHKQVYFQELDTLDEEIKSIIINKPDGGTAIRFNSSVDRIIKERVKESNNQTK